MWHRLLTVALAGLVSVGQAQEWNDAAARELVDRAVRGRATATADSSLHSYSACARGVVTFLVELGSAIGQKPQLVKGDELLVEVYWQRPDRSKQVILAWRDSTFFPSGLAYHRDHLGIVSDDFGAIIRIGDGDEVADVAHPLAPNGAPLYDFRVGDTVRVVAGASRVSLVALEVRPKDDKAPRVIGTFYLDLDRGAVVRSHLSFTPAAYRDGDLEDIAVRLDRALIDGRYWLPYRQEIEIRRRWAVLDFPLRGVIRARWDIGDHRTNEEPPVMLWQGPSIAGLRSPGGQPWAEPLTRSIDSSVSPADRRALADVRRAVTRVARGRLLDGLPRARLAVTRISEVLRVTRVEGLRIGAGLAWRPGGAGPVGRIGAGAAWATSAGRLTGSFALEGGVGSVDVALRAERQIVDVGDTPVVSQIVNSIAAQEGGRDLGDYVLLDRVALEAGWGRQAGTTVEVGIGREWAKSVATTATPARGSFRPNPPLGSEPYWVGRVRVSRNGIGAGGSGGMVSATAEGGLGKERFARVVVFGEGSLRLGPGLLNGRGLVGAATAMAPVRRSFVVGGTGTIPGEAFRAYGGRRAVWIATEWLIPIPGPRLGLGSFGKTSGQMWIGPLVAIGGAWGDVAGGPWLPSSGTRSAVGVGVELLDRAVRLEIGQSLHGGRGPTLSFDVSRRWWGIL